MIKYFCDYCKDEFPLEEATIIDVNITIMDGKKLKQETLLDKKCILRINEILSDPWDLSEYSSKDNE